MAATSLAVPIAAQALVNTVTKTLLIQPLLMLGLLLLVALAAVAILQVMQIIDRVRHTGTNGYVYKLSAKLRAIWEEVKKPMSLE